MPTAISTVSGKPEIKQFHTQNKGDGIKPSPLFFIIQWLFKRNINADRIVI